MDRPPIKIVSEFVQGIPRPKGNKKVYKGRPVEQSPHLQGWLDAIVYAFRPLPKFEPDDVLELVVAYVFPLPKSAFDRHGGLRPGVSLWHTGKPDLDNLNKAVGDALEMAGTLKDDCKIVLSSGSKKRDRPCEVGAHISLSRLGDIDQVTEEQSEHYRRTELGKRENAARRLAKKAEQDLALVEAMPAASKLSHEEVNAIRHLHASGKTPTQIAATTRASASSISKIITGRTYQGVK